MSDSEWTVATLKEHILALLAEKDRAIGAALSSAKEAVGKAEAAAERRFEGLNELRGAMSDQQATLISRETVDALFKSLTDKFDALTARVDRTEGRGAACMPSGSTSSAGPLSAPLSLRCFCTGKMMTILDSIDKLIEHNEGRRHVCYDDAHPDRILKAGDVCDGTPTIGVGCTGPDIVPGLVWTDAQIDAAFADRKALAMRRAALDLGPDCWSRLDIVRQAVLVDMAYQMGGTGLAKFKNMLSAIRTADWSAAHDALLDSAVARSQAPEREERNAEMLLTGEWPEVA